MTGAGTNLLNGGVFTLNGTVTASNLVLAGATLGGTSGVIMGGMTWTSGSIGSGSALTIATNGVLALAGAVRYARPLHPVDPQPPSIG